MVNPITPSIQSQLNYNNYVNLVSYTVLYYDYALTLPAEVDRFWSTQSLSWVSAFFYLNRYLTLFGHIPVMAQYYWSRTGANSAQVLVIQIIVGILLIMRTYALYDRSLRVLLFVCLCGLAVIIFGTWSVAAGHTANSIVIFPQIGCIPPVSRDEANRLARAWIGMLLFDTLIFGMTLFKSWRLGRTDQRSLLFVLLRDGAIYFGIMAFVGLLNILTFYVLPDYQRGFITTFANVVSSTMISRLMLNLRDPKRYRARFPVSQTPPSTYPVLSTVLDSNIVTSDATTITVTSD